MTRSTALIALLLSLTANAAPPNVVMIVSDDQGWRDYGFMGNAAVRTPSLDKLAAQAAVFPNGYVPTSLCRPSLASMITGQYPHEHKICTNDQPDGQPREVMFPFMKAAPAVPRLLAGAGYASYQTGKWWEGHFTSAGFTDGMTVKGRHGDDGLVIGRQTLEPMLEFVDKQAAAGKPFFLWYAPMMPHMPHNPPARLLAKYQEQKLDANVAKYYAMIEWFDETCGQLLDHLDKRGVGDNTVVVYLADNGWVQNLVGQPAKGSQGGPRGKNSPYDGGMRTPIMVRWPGHTKAGRYADLVSAIDLAPTILAACGVAQDPKMTGVSLLDAAAGRGPLGRDQVFGETFVHTSVDVENPGKNVTYRWTRKGDWKVIVSAKGEVELYDVAKDPDEKANLAAANPAKVEELTKSLDGWWKP